MCLKTFNNHYEATGATVAPMAVAVCLLFFFLVQERDAGGGFTVKNCGVSLLLPGSIG